MSTGEQLLLSGSTNTSREIVVVENYFLVGKKIIYACPKRTYISTDACCISNLQTVSTDLTPWRYLLDDAKHQDQESLE